MFEIPIYMSIIKEILSKNPPQNPDNRKLGRGAIEIRETEEGVQSIYKKED